MLRESAAIRSYVWTPSANRRASSPVDRLGLNFAAQYRLLQYISIVSSLNSSPLPRFVVRMALIAVFY
ncbi:hypothetical protein [Achromobacter mucicolens]|uniref:hypothetical protein n=1 Tax=Achromobacter mucicolens TaxID=1389922 RepID=UPI001CBCE300|nr:hypothetical protein [Achromobacter mucicolens]UAN05507.1 hypothetical protein K9D24_10740 [Achromobacter mucicolens]